MIFVYVVSGKKTEIVMVFNAPEIGVEKSTIDMEQLKGIFGGHESRWSFMALKMALKTTTSVVSGRLM